MFVKMYQNHHYFSFLSIGFSPESQNSPSITTEGEKHQSELPNHRNVCHHVIRCGLHTTQQGVAPYLRIFVFGIPDVGAGPHAVVSKVARRLVYPLPAQIFPEVDVQAPHAAGLSLAACEEIRETSFK